jgi:hypothetical protein
METISKDAIELAGLNYKYRMARDFVDQMDSYTKNDKRLQIRQALELNKELALIQNKTRIEMVSNRILQKNLFEFYDLLESL